MDKNILKSFATEAREELIKKVKLKAIQYGIKEDEIKNSSITSSDSIVINGRPLSTEERNQRQKLIDKIRALNEKGEDGYKQVIEEVAYTWFNRFIALRFMEVNNYLPTRVRALTSSNPESVEPDLLREASNINLNVDKQKIYEFKLNSDIEGLFKYMIIAQCDALNRPLSFMFEKIGHHTQLLFPDGLLNEGAFIKRLTDTEVIREDWWTNVEIIGWFYQYYIANEKDRVIKAKKKYKKDEIPFATQLFTPDWIVRYMVQNSLGRYWVESHPEHNELKEKWEFYLENPNPEPDFEEKLAPYINKELKVEDIKCFDPACGSGHILVYMFDVLYEIYEKCGYMSREIPELIIENNLYGLDIDDRAYQLACFAVVMKGMEYNNRLLRDIERQVERTGQGIKLNIASIQETNEFNNNDIVYLAGETSGENYEKAKEFIELFKNAKIYGSLIKVEKFDIEFFKNRLEYITNNPAKDTFEQESKNKFENGDKLENLIKQAEIMIKTYDVLVTNPPYIGSKYMNSILSNFINTNYEDVKWDLFSAFMSFCFDKVKYKGHLGFLTPFVWMFISSYEKLRNKVISHKNISSMIQFEYNAFPEACVPVCTFTLRNYNKNFESEFIKLSDFTGSENQKIKTLEAINNPEVSYRYTRKNNMFENIPSNSISYWLTDKMVENFKYKNLSDLYKVRSGITPGNTDLFIKLWYEVDYNKIGFNFTRKQAIISNKKWFPCNKGGTFNKWYGNREYIINWENDGKELKNYTDDKGKKLSYPRSLEYQFMQHIGWSRITSSKIAFRYFSDGFLFSDSSAAILETGKDANYLLGLLNSKISKKLLDAINPTMNFQVGDISKIPIIIENKMVDLICELVGKNINISKENWNSYETSWDFKNHPILIYKNNVNTIKEAYDNWSEFAEKQFYQLKENEEELNKIFIDIYGLQDEITPEVEEKDVTIRKADLERDIKSFISYAVGCMLGRYSLDQEGLIYAGGQFDSSKYTTFKADEDNIISILEDGYFEDDIVTKFIEFVRVTFGEETLAENLNFIAETLGKKTNESSKDTIRRYFLNDFFKDHKQVYKNRPIYWMFTSGKQKAFNCLIYMHRYDKTTLSRIRTDYLHELQDRLDAERKSIMEVIEGDYSTKEKSNAKKELTALDKKIDELKKYDEVLHHMADMQIEIDLDDGVAVNYEKFKGLVAKI